MNSMRLRPPRPPKERASRGRQTTEMGCRAEKVSAFGAKRVCSANRAARPDLAFPSRAAKQGRGNESVSGGDREPRLTEPQRDRCRRSRRMRCRFRVAEPFAGEKVTLSYGTCFRASALHLISQLTLTASPRRGSQGLRDQITQTIYLYHTNRKKPSFSFAPSERYLRSTPAARLSASVIPLP